MVINMKVIGKIIKQMVKEQCIIKMVIHANANSLKANWKNKRRLRAVLLLTRVVAISTTIHQLIYKNKMKKNLMKNRENNNLK